MEEYLENLELDGISKQYRLMARTALSRFARFAKTMGVTEPDEIQRTHIVHFQEFLRQERWGDNNDQPLAVSTQQQQMKYLRTWINWCEDLGYLSTSPWVRIKIGRQRKKPKPLEEDEVAALFGAHTRQAFSIPPFRFHRREVILTLLYGWGLRINELQALNVSNLDLRLDYVTVRNKGGGTKTLPYNAEMKQVVQRWLRQRAKHAIVGDDALVIDQQGKRLSIQMMRNIITDLGASAGVAVNPHRLRDTFGTTMLDNDVPVERIMAMMGHTQRSQTMAYSRLNDHKVKESHDEVMTPILNDLLTRKA